MARLLRVPVGLRRGPAQPEVTVDYLLLPLIPQNATALAHLAIDFLHTPLIVASPVKAEPRPGVGPACLSVMGVAVGTRHSPQHQPQHRGAALTPLLLLLPVMT